MTESAFNEKWLASQVALLQKHQRIAFGATCCERIIPNYLSFHQEERWGDIEALRAALDFVWNAALLGPSDVQAVRTLLSKCEALAPDSEGFDSLYTTSAQDAVFAVCSLLDFMLISEPNCIVNTARYPIDSIDLFVQECENMCPEDRNLERRILEQPLMQQELVRQNRDLRVVRQIDRNDQDALAEMKMISQAERAFVLGD